LKSLNKVIHNFSRRTKKSLGRFYFWLIYPFLLIIFLLFHDYLLVIFGLIFLLIQQKQRINHLTIFIKTGVKKSFNCFIHIVGHAANISHFCFYLLKKIFLKAFYLLIYKLERKIRYYFNLYRLKKAKRKAQRERNLFWQRKKSLSALLEKKFKVNKIGKAENNFKRENKKKTEERFLDKSLEEKRKKIIQVLEKAEKARISQGLTPKNTILENFPKNRKGKISKLIKEIFFSSKLQRRGAFILILVIILGIFTPMALRERRGSLEEIKYQLQKPIVQEEGKVLGEKTIKESSPLSLSQKFGRLLAGISLLFGFIFFIYSLKYYFSSLIVLIVSQTMDKKGISGRFSKFLYKLFFPDNNGQNGLNGNNGSGFFPNGINGELKNYPFISVHLAFYNEKKVANRILTACTSFDYPNYEVIVADDSTDETVEILKKWKKHPRVKIIHRETRSGFKGMALQEAVDHMDPRTEFVVVFDADFIPYPDTLKQFLKYFLNGSNNRNKGYKDSNLAVVQGYQWHVLNKNENWITRSVRSEFAGSYVIERPGREIMGLMKQIAGSVYMIRADVLKAYGWTDSITEDFELTLRIYRDGWKVLFTPYIQAPAECVSTLKRLIRQRMRWAEGHTRNVRRYFWDLMKSRYMNRREKLEFLYLAPYYLQSLFLIIGTTCWFISDLILHAQLPFWTALWGWSLVFVNLFALPILNTIGLFFEESPEKDYLGIFSFITLSYLLAPFQAAAALKGLLKKRPGTWFRTPKSGHITDLYFRSRYRRWLKILFPKKKKTTKSPYLKLASSANQFKDFKIKKRKGQKLGHILSILLLLTTLTLQLFSATLPKIDTPQSSGSALRLGIIKRPNDNSFTTGPSVYSFSTVTPQKEKRQERPSPSEQKALVTLSKEKLAQRLSFSESNQDNQEIKPALDLPRPQPGEPVDFKENLPKPIKEAVKIAWNNFPSDKEEVEIKELRTEKSEFFLRKDGKIRQEIGAGPLHYRDKKNKWQKISHEIKPIEDSSQKQSFAYANTTNYFQTYFKKNPEEENYLKFKLKDKEISLSFPKNAELGKIQSQKPEIKTNQITYPEIYPGIDLRYTIGNDSLLEEYIVKSPGALENLTYISQEFQIKGVSFEKGNSGLIQFKDAENGKKIWHFPRPVIYELNNHKERNYDLKREIEEKDGKYLSKKILEPKALDWLKSPERNYPIVIDESFVVDYTDTNYLDGYVVYDGSSYSKSEADTELKFGGDQTPDPDESYRAYIKFDITDLSDSITYEQVDLYTRVADSQTSPDTTDIKALPNDPNTRTASELYGDIGLASVYVNDTSYFQAVTYRLFNLGSTALSDLNSSLTNDWFGVSFQSNNESSDYGSICSEEYTNSVYRPRLAAIYDAIDTSTGYYMSTNSVSRNTFFDPKYGNYWVLAANSTERKGEAWYSNDDGQTWNYDSSSYTPTSDCYSITSWFREGSGGNDGDVYVAYYRGRHTYFNHGTVGETSITWDSYQDILDNGSWNFARTSVTVGTDGICWVAARYYDSGNSTYGVKTIQSTDSNCNSWTTTTQTNSAGTHIHPAIAPLNNGEVYVVWNEGSDMKGRRWNGNSWNTIDTICTSCTFTSTSAFNANMVADENFDLHLVYINNNHDITYQRYDESTATWSSAYTIHNGTDYYPNIALDSSAGEIYAFFLYIPNYYARSFKYYKCNYRTNDCLDSADWGTETTAYTGFYLYGLAASYKADGRVWFSYTEGLYTLNVKNIVIPENIWFLIPIIALLPKQIQKLLNKGRKFRGDPSEKKKRKKKRRSSVLSSVFGVKKRK